jgi:murein DD-endopeptidase MepM/ murein hydrolase activator NlpD
VYPNWTASFGDRRPTDENPNQLHWGIDIDADEYGDNVYAVSAGVIIATGTTSQGINYLQLDIGFSNMGVTYMHVNPSVTTGEVSSGQLIATVDADNVSTGPHVHIQMSYFGMFGGEKGNLIDPTPYFPQCRPARTSVRGRR